MPASPSAQSRPRNRTSLGDRFYAPRVRLIALYALLACAFLFGGGARADIYSLVLLRPLAILFAGYALIRLSPKQFAPLGVPVLVLLATMALAALQLVPLPPAVWTALPGRELVVQISRDTGMGAIWRPLTLTPGRTWNTLFALFVPLATFLLLAIQDRPKRDELLWPILAFGLASALLGLAQVIGPEEGPLYLYRITNPGNAVGFFANRNHNAIFLASLIPLLVYVALRAQAGDARANVALVGSIGLAAFIFPLILVNGSRAGAGAAIGALVASALLWWNWQRRRGNMARQRGKLKRWLGPLLLGIAALLGGLTWWLSRSLATQRMAGGSLADELRLKVLPYVVDMIAIYFPVGSGFGSFDLAYKALEPPALLMPEFLNQAHNDLLQPVIEGGAPAAGILVLACGWFAIAGFRCWRVFSAATHQGAPPDAGAFAWLSLAVLLAGSMVDYPLRTPSLMVVAVLLACIVQRSIDRVSGQGAEAAG